MTNKKKNKANKKKVNSSKKNTSIKKVTTSKKTTSNKRKVISTKNTSSSKLNNKSTKKINSKDIRKNNKRNFIFNILIIILSLIVIISFALLIQKKKEEERTLIEIDESKLVKPTNSVEKPISVEEEISNLKKKYNNNDIIGILNIDGLIYTPVVQTKDNQYYLKHSLSKKKSVIGSVFMDYRVNKDSKQINIYGHNHSNKKYNPPFKSLENYLNEDYFNSHNNIELKIDNEVLRYEIFSVVIADKVGTEEHMKLNYRKDSDWLKHFNRLKNRSIYKSDVTLNNSDKIIALQTCIYGKYAGKLLVVVGKKIN